MAQTNIDADRGACGPLQSSESNVHAITACKAKASLPNCPKVSVAKNGIRTEAGGPDEDLKSPADDVATLASIRHRTQQDQRPVNSNDRELRSHSAAVAKASYNGVVFVLLVLKRIVKCALAIVFFNIVWMASHAGFRHHFEFAFQSGAPDREKLSELSFFLVFLSGPLDVWHTGMDWICGPSAANLWRLSIYAGLIVSAIFLVSVLEASWRGTGKIGTDGASANANPYSMFINVVYQVYQDLLVAEVLLFLVGYGCFLYQLEPLCVLLRVVKRYELNRILTVAVPVVLFAVHWFRAMRAARVHSALIRGRTT